MTGKRLTLLLFLAAMPLVAQKEERESGRPTAKSGGFTPNINGAALPPGVAIRITDDGPARPPASSSSGTPPQSVTLPLATAAAEHGIVLTFCQHLCRFQDQKLAQPGSICISPGQQDIGIDDLLIAGGHMICNHTINHIPMPLLEGISGQFKTTISGETILLPPVISEMAGAEDVLDRNNLRPDGVRIARAPGLSTDAASDAMLNANPLTRRITGWLGMDSQGGSCTYNGVFIPGGDWDWYSLGFPAKAFAACHATEILRLCANPAGHGCVLENHDNQDGDASWALDAQEETFRLVNPHIIWEEPTAIPGIHGNTRLADPALFSSDFGADDGVGSPVTGDVNGDGLADVCKARAIALWGASGIIACGITSLERDGITKLEPPTSWLTIADPAWATAGYRFWLADVTGSGRADAIYATSGATAISIFVALSNETSFGQPQLWLTIAIPTGGNAATILPSIRFGHFFSNSGPKDLLFAADGSYYAAKNVSGTYGFGFRNPAAWNSGLPATIDPQTISVMDLDGDGFDDVVVRDPASGQFIVSQTATNTASVLPYGTGFKPAASWLSFAGQDNLNAWNSPTDGATVNVVNIGQPVLVGMAPSGTGIVYTRIVAGSDGSRAFLPGWRHLCNTCVTTDALAESGWHPERRQYGIVWGIFDDSGNYSAIIVRASGLDLAAAQLAQ
jgi:peptidoglycan/xylan/chitin deacetylase (PgdA/CDA1 family)